MTKEFPNKWVRKAVSDALNGLNVDGNAIPTFDTRVKPDPNQSYPKHYVIMSTQSASVDKGNKCEYMWITELLIDITTTYPATGNTGSRTLSDNIANEVKDLLNNLELDPLSNLKVVTQNFIFPNDLNSISSAEIIYRKVLQFQLLIN